MIKQAVPAPPTRRRWWCAVLGALFLMEPAAAPLAGTSPVPVMPVMATSRSGQFIVHGRDSSLPPNGGEVRAVGENELISLRPEVLVVMCERIRQTVNLRLGGLNQAGGRVHLYLRRRHTVESRLVIIPQATRESWQFHLELPDQAEWPRLVRALIEVVLLDQANRGNLSVSCVQPPFWLTEGMDELLLNEYGRDLALESQTSLNRSARRRDPLAPVRATLSGRNPAGFAELGELNPERLGDANQLAWFRASSALFLSELLRDRPGQMFVREFLQQLPRHLNWQTAFLRAGGGRFRTLLEVEKWWAVSAASELSHDPTLRWPRERVLSELRLILTETADVSATMNGPAVRRTLALAEIVRTWDFAAQQDVLRRKAIQLQLLRIHTPPALQGLVADCYRTLDGYLTERSGGTANLGHRAEPASSGRVQARTTARRLEELDRQVAAAARSS